MLNEYETVCILQPDLPSERQSKIREKIEKILSESKTKIVNNKDWGKKKLAYRIQKFGYGHYLFYHYEGDGHFISELERTLKFEEGVMRFLTVKNPEALATGKGKKPKKVDTVEEFVHIVEDTRPFMRGSERKKHFVEGENHATEKEIR